MAALRPAPPSLWMQLQHPMVNEATSHSESRAEFWSSQDAAAVTQGDEVTDLRPHRQHTAQRILQLVISLFQTAVIVAPPSLNLTTSDLSFLNTLA